LKGWGPAEGGVWAVWLSAAEQQQELLMAVSFWVLYIKKVRSCLEHSFGAMKKEAVFAAVPVTTTRKGIPP
jgi:hypothetical protein